MESAAIIAFLGVVAMLAHGVLIVNLRRDIRAKLPEKRKNNEGEDVFFSLLTLGVAFFVGAVSFWALMIVTFILYPPSD